MGGNVDNVLTLEEYLALVGPQKAEHRLECGGLTHPVSTKNCRNLVFAGLHIEVLQDIEILVVAHVQVTQLQYDVVRCISH